MSGVITCSTLNATFGTSCDDPVAEVGDVTGRLVALVVTLVVVDVKLLMLVSSTLSPPLGFDSSYTGLLQKMLG